MPLRSPASRIAMTRRLQSRIKRRAAGLFSRLGVEVVDHRLVVEARCASYHGVQMALAAIEAFVADFPEMVPAKADFMVGDRRLLLHGPFTKYEPFEQYVGHSRSSIRARPAHDRQPALPTSDSSKLRENSESLVAAGV